MEKIKFENGKAPYINDVNLNKLQDNIEIAIDEKSANIPVSDTEPTAEDVELWIDTSEYMAVFKYKDPNTQKWEIVNSTVTGDTLPIGAIIPYSSDNIPDNWLLADGRAVSRIEYKKLFDVIGVTYGSGDGSTTFNLPNLKGKIPVGQDEDSLEFAPLAMEGGEKTHTHSLENGYAKVDISDNNRPYWKEKSVTSYSVDKEGTDGNINKNNSSASVNKAVELGGNTDSESNLQPYLVTNYIIKAAQSSGVVATVVDSLESESETDALSARQGKKLADKTEKNIITGEEFETNKTIDGKRIYGKRINCGQLPNPGQSSATPTGLTNVTYIGLEGGFNPDDSQFVPCNTYFNSNLSVGAFIQDNKIRINNNESGSRTGIVYVTVYYTKE